MRNHFIDNAKYILVFMVVFGHMIEPILHESSAIKVVYLSIYSFHIPAFVLISGALSKSDITSGQFSKMIKSILVPFFVFTVLYEIFNLVTEGDISHATKDLAPYWLLWFLYSLFTWRLLLPIFLSFRYPIFTSICLSISAGYLDSIGYSLGLSRTLYFLPFFIIGYKLRPKLIEQRKAINISAIALVSILVANLAIFLYLQDMQQQWLYGSYSFSRLNDYGIFAGAKRLLIYAASFITAIAVLQLIPDREMRISQKGKNSLHVYVWHGFFVKALSSAGLIAAIGQFPALSSLLILFILSVLLTVLLSSNPIANGTQNFLIAPINKALLTAKA